MDRHNRVDRWELEARNEIQSLMGKIREQMESVWSRFPTIRSGNFSDNLPGFPNFGALPPFSEIDLGKGNTTSEIKIIDGRKVIINETEYHRDTPNGSAFIKVRVVDVLPPNANTERDSEEGTTSPSGHVIKDREPLENSVENEIYKNKEAMFYQPLELDHVDSASLYPPSNFVYESDNSEWNDLNRIEPISDNLLNFGRNPPVIDLSRDTYVNDLLAQSGAPVNPDAEIIEIVPQGSSRRPLDKFQYPR